MIGGMHKNAEIKDFSVTLKASRCRRGLKSNGPCGVSTRVWLLGWDVGRHCMLSAFTPEGRRDGSLVLSQQTRPRVNRVRTKIFVIGWKRCSRG